MYCLYGNNFGWKFNRGGYVLVMIAKDNQDLGCRGDRLYRCCVGQAGIIMDKRKTVMKIPLFFCKLGNAPVDIDHLADIVAVRISDFNICSRSPVTRDYRSNSLLAELTGEI